MFAGARGRRGRAHRSRRGQHRYDERGGVAQGRPGRPGSSWGRPEAGQSRPQPPERWRRNSGAPMFIEHFPLLECGSVSAAGAVARTGRGPREIAVCPARQTRRSSARRQRRRWRTSGSDCDRPGGSGITRPAAWGAVYVMNGSLHIRRRSPWKRIEVWSVKYQ